MQLSSVRPWFGQSGDQRAQQDHQGFIWIGTEGGLYRFDAAKFTEYGRESGLPSRFILAVDEDVTGRLWVVTDAGLAYQDRDGQFVEVQYRNHPLAFASQAPLAVAPSGRVLIGVGDQLLALGLPGRNVEFQQLIPPPRGAGSGLGRIGSVSVDAGGRIIFGCGDAICQLESGILTRFGPNQGVPADSYVRVVQRQNGEVWARSAKYIVRRLPGTTRFARDDLPPSVNDNSSAVLVEDPEGRMLAGLNSGVARFEDEKWRIIGERNGFIQGTVKALIIDRDNQPWLGFDGRGVASWLGYDNWEHWTRRQGLASDKVWAVLRDSRGRLWVGQQRGLSLFDPGSTTFHSWQGGVEDMGIVRSLAESADGYIWAGTWSGRLFQIDVKTQRLVGTTQVGGVSRVYAAPDGRVWVATLDGLFESEGSGLQRRFHPVAQLNGKGGIDDVAQAPDGALWAVTDTQLLRGVHQNWQSVDISKAGLSNNLYGLAFDKEGWLWVSSFGDGAARFQLVNGVVRKFERVRLGSESVLFLAKDGRGWMWIGEDRGIEVYDGRTLHPFSISNGLIWNDCDSNAVLVDNDRSVWLGTSAGLSHYSGERLPIDVPSKPVLTEVDYGTLHLKKSGQTLGWSRSPLIFNVASLNFQQGDVRYRYRLVGLESRWNETSMPQVRYTELRPKTYRFEVAALNSSSGRLSPIEAFYVNLTPPWVPD